MVGIRGCGQGVCVVEDSINGGRSCSRDCGALEVHDKAGAAP